MAGSGCWAGHDACGVPTRCSWDELRCPRDPVSLLAAGFGVCAAFRFALPAGSCALGMVMGGPWQEKVPVPQPPCPRLPPQSFGSAAKLESTLKVFFGGHIVLCLLPIPIYLFAALIASCEPAPLCPTPCPTHSGTVLLPNPSLGTHSRLHREQGSWKSLSPFPQAPSCFPCSAGLCSRSFSRSRPFQCFHWGPTGRAGSPGWDSSWQLWLRVLCPASAGAVDVVGSGTGAQSMTRCS